MTTLDTIELLYEAFKENPTRLTYSTKKLQKQYNANEEQVFLAKQLYKKNPIDFTVAQAMIYDEGIYEYDSIPASELFEVLTGEKDIKWLNVNGKKTKPVIQKQEDEWLNKAVEDMVGKKSFNFEKYTGQEYPELITKGLEIDSDNWEVKQRWVKGPEGSKLMVKKDSNQDLETLREQILRDVKQYAPKYKKTKPDSKQGGNLLIISLGDLHLGKLSVASETGEDYNVDIAYDRAIEGVKGLIQKASGFSIDTVLLIIGNDILHTDTLDRKTSNKTPQDTDGMWHENFLRAKDLYVEVIEMLMPLGNVYVQFNDSNHDRMSGFFLAQTIEAWFRNSDITFDVTMRPRKYFQYGVNLIGTSHGESKEADLPLIMATECPEEWATSTKRYWYCHHIHHKKSKEYMGVCVEYLRSPSGTDAWHSRNGYLSNKALEAFVHDVQEGQVCRLTQYIM